MLDNAPAALLIPILRDFVGATRYALSSHWIQYLADGGEGKRLLKKKSRPLWKIDFLEEVAGGSVELPSYAFSAHAVRNSGFLIGTT